MIATKPLKAALAGAAVLVSLLFLAGCGVQDTLPVDSGTTITESPTTGTSSGAGADTGTGPPAGAITRDDPSGVVAGLVLTEPVSLEEARALGRELGGDLISLYRTDVAMVRPLPELINAAAGEVVYAASTQPSRFTYVDVGDMHNRYAHLFEGYWLHWEDQWAKAEKPGVKFEAMGLYVPKSALDSLREDPRFRGVAIIDHHRSPESLSSDYPGELFLREESFPSGFGVEPEPLPIPTTATTMIPPATTSTTHPPGDWTTLVSFSGSGEGRSETFTLTGAPALATVDVSAESDPLMPFFELNLVKQGAEPDKEGYNLFESAGGGDMFPLQEWPPGTYYLDIHSRGYQWKVTIEEKR